MGLMAALSGWLRQIIAAVLLASLLDLLLPNRTMQRYVRLVAGLFILLTVITPVLSWIKGDFSSKLAAGLQAGDAGQMTSADDLSRIQADARKLQDRQSADAAELMGARLREAIRADVQQSEQRAVASVDVGLERLSDGTLSVKSVVVTLAAPGGGAASDAAASPESSRPIGEVKPVAPVTVVIAPDNWTDEKTGGENAADAQMRRRIAAFIAGRYGISAERVEVKQAA